MTEGGFFERQPINKTGLTLVIAIHAAAITALALSKMEVVVIPEPPIFGKLIEATQDPPPNPPEPVEKQLPSRQETVTRPDPEVQLAEASTVTFDTAKTTVIDETPGPTVAINPPRPIGPPKEPVRIAAVIDPRVPLQPAYPPSEQRLGNEGAVVVRVLVGTDGRVKAVEKVKAESEAFFRSTERQALRYWRFRPATVDGKPVESWQVMTVRFEMSA